MAAIHNFLRDSEIVTTFRNTVQHLPGTIREAKLGPNWSVWGSLTWCVPNLETGEIRSCLYSSGRIKTGTRELFDNRLGAIRMPAGRITLFQDTARVCISDLVGRVEALAIEVQEMCRKTFADPRLSDTYGSDFVARAELRPSIPEHRAIETDETPPPPSE
jgi:hypothetical protein